MNHLVHFKCVCMIMFGINDVTAVYYRNYLRLIVFNYSRFVYACVVFRENDLSSYDI